MSHLCTTGVPCGLPDGHRWHHHTIKGIERRRERDAERKRIKYATDPEWAQRERDSTRSNVAANVLGATGTVACTIGKGHKM